MQAFDAVHRAIHYPPDRRFRVWIDPRFLFAFAVVALAPVATGFAEYNAEHTNHGQPTLTSPKSKPVLAPRVETGW